MKSEEKDIDDHTGVETTGHSWDGIKELNNPLPRWWLIIWYISIAWALVYMVLYPAIPALPGMGDKTNTVGILGQSDRVSVDAAVAEMKVERAEDAARLIGISLDTIETDRGLQQFALEMGESLFGDNCATCHGAGGRGAKGYPALADDVWLWDGSVDGIEQTIRHGIRQMSDEQTRMSMMPSFGRDGLLAVSDIEDLTQFVLSLSGREANAEAAARAAPLFQTQCAMCHGDRGEGKREMGAPDLTDQEWLFGGTPRDVYGSIYNARNAHMPAWDTRLDDASIKALAVYVHTLGADE
ncbi:MAG: cytochrome-c oxidase, cbb3-type subunit III [Hyphomonas sp.]